MMKAIVLQLQQVNEEPLAPSHGTYAYAAALELLLHLDPVHATHLHYPETHKPLTVSPIFRGSGNDANRAADAATSSEFHRRLTALEPDTARLLAELGPRAAACGSEGRSLLSPAQPKPRINTRTQAKGTI